MKKVFFVLLLTIFSYNYIHSQKTILMENVNGIYQIPCKVNGIPMKFIFDTGASDVSISITEAKFLLKQNLLSNEDFIENVNYQIANGDIIEGTKINLKSIEIDDIILYNISATVIHQQNAPLLFGQSAISKIGEYTINENKLILNNSNIAKKSIIADEESLQNNINCNPVIGYKFNAKRDYLNLKVEPNINSTTIISPKKDGFWLECVEDGMTNDYVKVELYLNYEAFEEKGIDQNTNFLYNEKLKNSGISLKEFFILISNDDELRKIYNKLVKDNSFENWSYEDGFYKKMETFEGFKDYWIKFDNEKLDINYIIENQERILYVHKSDIEKNTIGHYYTGQDEDFYLKKINEFISFKEKNSCAYDEDTFFGNFSEYINRVISRDPFFALQKINLYSNYFKLNNNKIKIEKLKMYSAYEDENYEATITTAKNIINDFKVKKEYIILNGKIEMYGSINLEEVYGYLISSLLKSNKINEAYNYSNECLKNEYIQFEQFLEFHTFILKKLNKTDEICDILNREYLKGNAKAKALKVENCK
jgi:clan AA aspartic protease (TIGR02281 family)